MHQRVSTFALWPIFKNININILILIQFLNEDRKKLLERMHKKLL